MLPFNEYKAMVGRRIQGKRAETGMSLRAFGMMAGIHYNQLLHIEQGKVNPSLETLYKIADALETDIIELLR